MSLTGYNPYTYDRGFRNQEFHHAVLSVSGTWHTLYLDGVQVAQNLSGGNVFASYQTITNTVIGAQTTLSQAFQGTIGDVRVYNYAIPPTLVTNLYRDRELVVYYPFDTSVNSLTPNYATLAYDASLIGQPLISASSGANVGSGALTMTNTAGAVATQYVKTTPGIAGQVGWKLDVTHGITIACWINVAGVAGRVQRIFDIPLSVGTKGLGIDISGTNMLYSSWNAPAAIPFAPTQISGIQLWLDAADNTFTNTNNAGGTVTWVDKSGSGNNATSFNASSTINKSTIGSNVCINFPASDQLLLISNLRLNIFPLTFFAVYNLIGAANTNRIISSDFYNGNNGTIYNGSTFAGDSQLQFINAPGNKSILIAYGGAPGDLTGTYTLPNPTGLCLLTVQLSGSGQNITRTLINLNGTNQQTATVNRNTINVTSAMIQSFSGMNVSEILFYRSELSPANYQSVEGYLAWKWGLQTSLPTTHPYYIQTPATTSVAGPIDSLSATAKNAMLGTGKSAGAYGTRVLYSGYTGPVMNIRNGTSNATQDFYSDAVGNLGTAFLGKGTSLATWIGTDNAYVTTWYDQTGNGNHGTQTTTTLQPVYNQTNKYVDFGTSTTGGRVNAYFNLPSGTVPYNNSSYTVVTKHGTLNTVGSSSGFSIGILGAGIGESNLQNNSFGISNGNRNYTNWWYNNDAGSAGVYVPNNVVTFTYLSNSTGSTRAIFLNGTTSAVTITGDTRTQNISPPSPHYLGTNQIVGTGPTRVTSALNGPLYYMYIAPSVLPTADRLILEST